MKGFWGLICHWGLISSQSVGTLVGPGGKRTPEGQPWESGLGDSQSSQSGVTLREEEHLGHVASPRKEEEESGLKHLIFGGDCVAYWLMSSERAEFEILLYHKLLV